MECEYEKYLKKKIKNVAVRFRINKYKKTLLFCFQ